MEYVEKLANLIMIQYYLAADLDIHDADFSVEEAEIGQKALDECGGHDLSSALDNYIKEHDWTGYLGTAGSGNRERHFAVEGFFEANNSHLKYPELDESKHYEEGFETVFYDENDKTFKMVDDNYDTKVGLRLYPEMAEKFHSLLPKMNALADKEITIYNSYESNPFYDSTYDNYFFYEGDAQENYDENCGRQGGRGSYDDDEGGMDYGIDEYTITLKEFINGWYSGEFDVSDTFDYINNLEASLEERAMEIGNGKVYAVQDAFYTRKTHDATGDRDIWIKNGDKDPNLTSTEKDIARKSIEVLKQMGKLGDISKEYNVDHGPDLTYIPVEDTVKVTPDNGSQPYKIKIPEALSFLKSYEYDILDEAVAVYTKADECKKALQESFSAIETVSPADNKNFGYLENEVTIFKIK